MLTKLQSCKIIIITIIIMMIIIMTMIIMMIIIIIIVPVESAHFEGHEKSDLL